MTFAPKKKTSKSRSKTRTTNWIKLSAKKLLNRVQLQFANETAIGLAHFADENGQYNGRQVLAIKTKQKNVTRV